jgi:hypothetical protein
LWIGIFDIESSYREAAAALGGARLEFVKIARDAADGFSAADRR